jgi:hypothetical protein
MEATRKFIQIVRFVLLGAIVIYGLIVFRLPSSATPKPIVLQAITRVDCLTCCPALCDA